MENVSALRAGRSLMFHHFTNDDFPAGQGAITSSELRQIIEYTGVHNILSAQDWLSRVQSRESLEGKACLTFDDALLCQLDVALPVLKE